MDRRQHTKNPDILNGVEEVAEYLNISTRTVLSWESKHSLPLMRPAGKRMLYASKEAIELWRRGEQ